MKELFSEDQLYEKCLEEKDQELARTLWKNIWEKDKLETLKEILGDVTGSGGREHAAQNDPAYGKPEADGIPGRDQ